MGLKKLFRNEEERGGGKGDWGIILFVRRGSGRGDYVNLISLIFLDFLKMCVWCIRIYKNYMLSVLKIYENWIYNK